LTILQRYCRIYFMETLEKESQVGLASKDAGAEARKQAAILMGSVKSDKKTRAANENLAKRPPDKLGGRKAKPIEEYPCVCGLDIHHWSCPRGQAIKRREKMGAVSK
jgi:hypothetical protein